MQIYKTEIMSCMMGLECCRFAPYPSNQAALSRAEHRMDQLSTTHVRSDQTYFFSLRFSSFSFQTLHFQSCLGLIPHSPISISRCASHLFVTALSILSLCSVPDMPHFLCYIEVDRNHFYSHSVLRFSFSQML